MIEFKKIKKTYNKQVVVDIDKLCLEEGEFYSLIGANGSGKSTFARIISAIIKPDSGKLVFIPKGVDENGKKKYLQVGYLPQKAYMFDMSLENNIKIGCNDDNKANDLIAKFDLDSLRGKNAKKFSGGEQQKVALARFMMQDFDFIILDEPTSAMDKKSEANAEQIIKKYAKDKTLILITHELDQARRFTEKQLVMNSGKILEV